MLKKDNGNNSSINSYVINQAKYYSNKLIANGYYNNYEREDLFQEFIVCYLKHKNDYDASKSSFKVYVTFIFQNLNKDLIIRSTKKRKVPITYKYNNGDNNLTDYED